MNEIETSVRKLHEAWRIYARGGPVEESDGVLAAWAGAQWPIVNALFITSPVAGQPELRTRLEWLGAFAARQSQFGMLVTCDAWMPAPAEAEAELSQHGWILAERLTGMVVDTPLPADNGASGLEFRKVDGPELRRAVADINALSYGVPVELGREAVDREALWDERCFGYVGFEQGNPVTTATTYVLPDCLYVALVATVPEARKRGYGAAATRYSLHAAARESGAGCAILHATSMAHKVYERLGFRSVTAFSMHLPAALLQATTASH
jgi:GNAT superfamily N-acetyltransferase